MSRVATVSRHFDRVACKYANVRVTDPQVIEPIMNELPSHNRLLDIVDVGCGTGRYTSLMAQRSDRPLRLFCCDYSRAMLAECTKRMNCGRPSKSTHYCRVSAEDLPFTDKSFDGIVTFNAIHHFNLDRFVTEASRLLRCGGLLSIYTRTPEQNAHTVWGQHFPGFAKRETRLHSSEKLEKAIGRTSGLRVKGIHEFKTRRTESVESLLKRTRDFHYSTFALYPPDEFSRALETFGQRLSEFGRGDQVTHTAENTLVLARREADAPADRKSPRRKL